MDATTLRTRFDERNIRKVKVGGFDVDGVLRGKYVSLDKLKSALSGGFGFCDVIFGWDIADVLYDNAKVTGWHSGYPDAHAVLDPATLRTIPWEPSTVALLADWMWRSMFWGRGRDRDRGGGGAIIAVIAIALAVLTPIIATLIQLAVSRQREYLADASGALLTRYPPGLASALRKIAADKEPLEVANKATAALYIANPLKDAPAFFDHLFDTHPPIEERIKRLEAMN